MNIDQIIKELNITVWTLDLPENGTVTGAYVSDLLSDVLGNAKEGEVWITIQSHLNVIAIATLKDMAAILLPCGKKPDKQVVAKANEEGILLLGSNDTTFELAGKLYRILNNHEKVSD